jgi:hypothetical protein
MGSARALQVSLELVGASAMTGEARIIDRSWPTRAGRALVALAGGALLAIPLAFIPLMHFVLVPSCLFTGLLLAVLRLREDRSLVALSGACPRCRVERNFDVRGRFVSGRTVHCDGCGSAIYVLAVDVDR